MFKRNVLSYVAANDNATSHPKTGQTIAVASTRLVSRAGYRHSNITMVLLVTSTIRGQHCLVNLGHLCLLGHWQGWRWRDRGDVVGLGSVIVIHSWTLRLL